MMVSSQYGDNEKLIGVLDCGFEHIQNITVSFSSSARDGLPSGSVKAVNIKLLMLFLLYHCRMNLLLARILTIPPSHG